MATKTATKAKPKAASKPLPKAASKLLPYGDRLVVRHVRQEEVTSSGLVIPDTALEKPQQGEVLAVGPGRIDEGKRIPLEVKVGDRILFAKYAGQEVKFEQEEYLVLKEADVLAKVAI